jgi:Gpi18-like mannosyltransferase
MAKNANFYKTAEVFCQRQKLTILLYMVKKIAYVREIVKKILCEPLFYLVPLLIAAFLMLISTDTTTEISEVKLTRNDKTQNITLPYSANMEYNEVFFVFFNLTLKNKSVKLNIIPDDCIQEILVNGEQFSLEGVKGLCNDKKGVSLDFSKYIQDGLNRFEIRIINSGGGPAGINVVPYDEYGNFSLMHYIFVLLVLISFVIALKKLNSEIHIFLQSLLKLFLLFAATMLLYFIASSKFEIIPSQSVIFLICIFIGASSIFLFNKRINCIVFAFILTVLAPLVLVRGAMLYFKSVDYNNFLSHWISRMRDLSIAEAMIAKIGDYNMPYMYVLMLISRFQISDLYLIKLATISFDIVLAYYAMKMVSIKFESINVQIAAFITTLCIPTVILNGAFWGQCDVIYAALALAFLYYGITDKSIKAYIFLGLAFSVKLQTIFIAPMLLVFLFTKKIHIKHIWVLLATFIATLVPALIAGRSFVGTISIYSEQTDSYPNMVLNTPNIYTLLGNVNFGNFNFAAIMLAGIATISLLYFLYINREKIATSTDYVSIAFVFVLLMPMLLPRMHERYFFMADVLSVVLVFFNKKRWYFAPIIIMGSYMTYVRFLLGREYLIQMEYASIIMVFVTLIAIKDLVERLKS